MNTNNVVILREVLDKSIDDNIDLFTEILAKFNSYEDHQLLLIFHRKCIRYMEAQYNMDVIKPHLKNMKLTIDERFKLILFLSAYYKGIDEKSSKDVNKLLIMIIKAIIRYNVSINYVE